MNRNVCGLLVGLGAGVGVGMLLAPRSGEKTRSQIRKKAADGVTYLRERGFQARDAAAEAIREGAQTVNKGTAAAKAAALAGRQAFHETMRS